jgi:preprotein translocase subunit Sss1
MKKLKAPAKKKAETESKSFDSWDQRPTLNLKSSDVPEVKNFKVGDTIKLEVNAIVESVSKPDNESEYSAYVRVVAIGMDNDSDES